MANGFYMAQAQPLDYGPLIQGAGAATAGFAGGMQRGMQMREQMQAMQERQAQREALEQEATQQEQVQGLAMQAAQGDPEAMQALSAVDPERAIQMQQLVAQKQEMKIEQEQAQREVIGSLGSMIVSGKKNMVRSTFNRAVTRIREEGDSEADVGLPTRAQAADMTDDELYEVMQDVGEQMSAYGLGPQAERGPLVQVATGEAAPPYKVPAGYMMKDPEQPELGVKPIPGTELEKKIDVGKFTEGQTGAARYAYNMVGATEVIDELEGAGITGAGIAGMLKRGAGVVGQYAMKPEEQQYVQAQNDWIAAKLRKESGAAIPPEELEGQRKIYFPAPGDSPQVIKQKARSRARAQKGMIGASQGAYKSLFQDQPPEDLAKTAEGAEKPAAAAAAAADFGKMTDEELLEFARTQL